MTKAVTRTKVYSPGWNDQARTGSPDSVISAAALPKTGRPVRDRDRQQWPERAAGSGAASTRSASGLVDRREPQGKPPASRFPGAAESPLVPAALGWPAHPPPVVPEHWQGAIYRRRLDWSAGSTVATPRHVRAADPRPDEPEAGAPA